MFPKNCWYVAAMSHEIAVGAVISRMVCSHPMAIYRSEDGTASALHDRCPHRLYPLSAGTVEGSNLRCGYHGLAFGSDGKCVEIPSQDEIPPNACTRAFPTREAHGLIWIWPGDVDQADSTELPGFETGEGYLAGLDLSCMDPSPTWGVAGPHIIDLPANYMLAIDNLLDLTHTAFVHANTFDNAGVLGSERTIRPVGANQLIDFFGFKNTMSKPLRTGYILDENVLLFDNYLETYWQAPGVMILVHGAVPEGGDREQDGAIVLNVNILTPATETTSHYFWAQCVYRNRGDGKVRDMWEAMTIAAFAEDEVTLANQQQNLARLGSTSLNDDVALILKADKAIVLARRIVSRMIREESRAKAG